MSCFRCCTGRSRNIAAHTADFVPQSRSLVEKAASSPHAAVTLSSAPSPSFKVHGQQHASFGTFGAGMAVTDRAESAVDVLRRGASAAHSQSHQQRREHRELRRNASRGGPTGVGASDAVGAGPGHRDGGGGGGDPAAHAHANEITDNNGLSRGQNFARVERWLLESARYKQTSIAPVYPIVSIEAADTRPLVEAVDPPTELDRLPPVMPSVHSQLSSKSSALLH
jgi:hypothetical protein